MTELTDANSANPIHGVNKPGTIGVPYPGNAFRVVDVEDPDKEMPRGERGGLMFRRALVMMGYCQNRALRDDPRGNLADPWREDGGRPLHLATGFSIARAGSDPQPPERSKGNPSTRRTSLGFMADPRYSTRNRATLVP